MSYRILQWHNKTSLLYTAVIKAIAIVTENTWAKPSHSVPVYVAVQMTQTVSPVADDQQAQGYPTGGNSLPNHHPFSLKNVKSYNSCNSPSCSIYI